MTTQTVTQDRERGFALIDRLLAAGDDATIATSRGGRSLRQLRIDLVSAPPADVAAALRLLEERAPVVERRQQFDQSEAEREARHAEASRPLQPGDPEHAEAQRILEEARAIARRDGGPATYGQIADLIAVTRDVLDELRKRG